MRIINYPTPKTTVGRIAETPLVGLCWLTYGTIWGSYYSVVGVGKAGKWLVTKGIPNILLWLFFTLLPTIVIGLCVVAVFLFDKWEEIKKAAREKRLWSGIGNWFANLFRKSVAVASLFCGLVIAILIFSYEGVKL